jgi:hypothetical protein
MLAVYFLLNGIVIHDKNLAARVEALKMEPGSRPELAAHVIKII